jgi:hypothetical protein
MSGPASAAPTFYRPAEVAAMLRCSEWWIKEQARNRRIPYAWIGGSYLFTEQHIAEIVHRFEVLPVEEPMTMPPARRAAGRAGADDGGPVVRLQSRPPRRARVVAEPKSSAA